MAFPFPPRRGVWKVAGAQASLRAQPPDNYTLKFAPRRGAGISFTLTRFGKHITTQPHPLCARKFRRLHYRQTMFHILLPAAAVALTTTVLAADLEESLVFRASFDSTLEAEIGAGDRKLYWSHKMEVPPKTSAPGLPASAAITHEKAGGVSGGYLMFQKKAPEMVFFHAKGNMPYNKTNW